MKFPEQYRYKKEGEIYASETGDPFGRFVIPARFAKGRELRIIAADGEETGWEHVSVSTEQRNKCPSWDEMCLVKNLFWESSECVVQFHPMEEDYVNIHPGVLHLWKCVGSEFPMPPTILV